MTLRPVVTKILVFFDQLRTHNNGDDVMEQKEERGLCSADVACLALSLHCLFALLSGIAEVEAIP